MGYAGPLRPDCIATAFSCHEPAVKGMELEAEDLNLAIK